MQSRFKSLEAYDESSLEQLRNSKVAVVGLGATGSVIAEHMARHGVNLVLVDRDYLEENDLYSSNFYTRGNCEKALPKAEAAKKHLKEFTEIRAEVKHLSKKNAGTILKEADIVLDGSDNMETRIIIDEFCRKENIPWVYTAAIAEKAYSMFLHEKEFSDLFDAVEDLDAASCETEGIMREYSAIAGSKSSLKAVRYLTGKNPEEKLEAIHLQKAFQVEKTDGEIEPGEEKEAQTICGDKKYQLKFELDEDSLENLKHTSDSFQENKYLVKASNNGKDITAFRSGRIVVEAEDEGHARQRVSELLGV